MNQIEKIIDIATWNRKEHFEHFSAFDDPFFGVTVKPVVNTLRQQAADIGFVLQSPEQQVVTDKLVELFGKEHPGYTRQDFYELELATSGMLRSFMARKCDQSFTMEQKLRRFLSCGMTIYGVDQEKQQEVIDQVLKMDLKSVADQLLAQAMAQSQEEFQEAERKGKALEAARRG